MSTSNEINRIRCGLENDLKITKRSKIVPAAAVILMTVNAIARMYVGDTRLTVAIVLCIALLSFVTYLLLDARCDRLNTKLRGL